ncbi:MAG: hypothetical protein NTW19_14725 [Planctomycetota bacterium]|nr:hypothetical protein [Planctomycetota bacterium]
MTLRPWGFASVRAGVREGELLTRPLRVGKGELRLNFATSAIGSVQVEVQDEAGRAMPGFELAQSPKRFGDELDAPWKWTAADFRSLAGRTVRLRVVLSDADIFAIRVAETG